jgi:hypothetical protein
LPLIPVTLVVKFELETPVTGSENVTVQRTEDAPVGDGSSAVIDETVGGVRSISHVYDAGELMPAFAPLVTTART